MSEVYIDHGVHHTDHHHYNTNYSMDMKSALNDERDKVLFYAIIIIFTVLMFVQTVFFSYYIFIHCCENTPCKRISRKRGLAFALGELEHNLDKEELETSKRLENQH
tara:strand:+ start:868 stop:1188 length:321 start_codon:yes stop_codon:yes gene_type:complete